MIAITCSSCQKKLSVKENLAGKKVKCPGCGQLTVVPVAVAAGATENEDLHTLPPALSPDAPSHDDVSSSRTNPPSGNPDATVGVKPDAGPDLHLIDFLAPPQAADELGRLGKYRILKILGHGGMGVVYEAEDPKLKRIVAIKAMLPTLASSSSCGKRFMREAEAMAAVEHDHIVRIYQIDEERNVPFMAMEFLKGEPLDVRLKRDEPIPLADLLRIGREIAEGLAAAHAKVLIHRDIKPGNIWLEAPKNRVKILDFGLARAASQEAGLTQQGAIIGTPAYMAPEQGRGGKVDARCDLFSLGVVLYRMSTGDQPYYGTDTVSTLMAVATHDPPAPIKLNRQLPRAFSELVMKLLEKDPDDRPASADEVIQTLHEIEKKLAMQKLSEEKTEAIDGVEMKYAIETPRAKAARSSSGTERARAGTTRGPATVIALVVGLVAVFGTLLLGVGAIVFYWQTDNGTVRIEINDPDIQVTFDKTGPTLKGINGQPVTISAGEHGLHIKRGDLEFDTDKFIVRRGETITLKIEWFQEGKVQVAQGNRVLGEGALPKVDVPIPPAPVAVGNALRFVPGTTVQVPTLNAVRLGQMTFEGFVTNLGNGGQVIVGEGHSLWIPTADSWQFSSLGTVLKPGKPATDQRVHVAAVRSDKEIRLYQDGKLVGTKSIEGTNMPLKLAAFHLGGTSFNGLISEVRISRVARYNQNFAPPKRFEPDQFTVALYHFEEGSGDVLKDSSGNNHHGQILGAQWVKEDGTPLALPKAPSGPRFALRYDGNARVDVPTLLLPQQGPLCMEAYVTLSAMQPINNIRFLGNGQSCNLGILGNRLGLNVLHANNNVSQAVSPVALPPLGKRFHIAGVKNNTEMRLYVDGQLVAVTNLLPNFPVRAGLAPLTVGFGPFIGTLDEVRISKALRYDKNFTPAQRFEPDADTLALYHFDEGSGSVLKDSSGNGHHGTIVGARWVSASPRRPFLDPANVVIMDNDGLLFDTRLTPADPKDPLRPGFFTKVIQVKLFKGKSYVIDMESTEMDSFLRLEDDKGQPLAQDDDSGGGQNARIHWQAQADGTYRILATTFGAVATLRNVGAFTLRIREEPLAVAGQSSPLYVLSFKSRWNATFNANCWGAGFSSDNRLFLAGGDANSAGNVPIWESATGKLVRELVPANGVWFSNPRFVPGSSQFVVVAYSKDKDLYLWDATTGAIVRRFVGHTTSDPGFALSPNGKRILSWGDDLTVRLWDLETGKEITRLEGHTDKAKGAFSPDGKRILTFSPDMTVRLWDAETGKEPTGNQMKKLTHNPGKAPPGNPPGFVGCFSPDSNRMLSYSGDSRMIQLWDIETKKEVWRFNTPWGRVQFAEFVGHGRLVVVRTEDRKLLLVDGATGRLVRAIDRNQFGPVPHDDQIAVSPDGRLALARHMDGSVRVLDLASGLEIRRFVNSPAQAFAFSPDGTLAAAGSFRKGVYVFRLPPPSGDEAKVFTGLTGAEFQKAVDVLRNQGYRPVHLKGYAQNQESRYDITWKRTDGPEWWLVHGWTTADFEKRKQVLAKDGFRVTLESSWEIKGQRLHCALWEQNSRPPLDPAWFKQVEALPAEQQVKAVADKLRDRNPGFDGVVTPHYEGNVVTMIAMATDNVTDLSPVIALTGLRTLDCRGTGPGKGQLADLTPLKDLQLTQLDCSSTRVADLSPVKNMKLTNLWCENTQVADLAPLKGMPLRTLSCDYLAERDAEILRSIKTLEKINGQDAQAVLK